MKQFADIQGALDYALKNQAKLRFPLTCKCNGVGLRVLSPDLARTTHRNGASLVVSRTASRALELGYVVSVNALEELLKSVSSSEGHYQLLSRDEGVTVACYSNGDLTAEFKFPIARRRPDLAAEEGDFVLLNGGPKTSDLRRFWLPLECRLLQSSIAAA
jgi:hypothetical protein